jgi:predicted nucleic acid-binding protein
MIVVDTNVVSELMKPRPADAVASWLKAQSIDDLWTTAITEAELLVGAAIMPEGRKKRSMYSAIEAVLQALFSGRILPFDSDAARSFPEVVVRRRLAGLDIDEADAQIAAIAGRYDAPVITRNVRHYVSSGVKIFNPWTFAS